MLCSAKGELKLDTLFQLKIDETIIMMNNLQWLVKLGSRNKLYYLVISLRLYEIL